MKKVLVLLTLVAVMMSLSIATAADKEECGVKIVDDGITVEAKGDSIIVTISGVVGISNSTGYTPLKNGDVIVGHGGNIGNSEPFTVTKESGDKVRLIFVNKAVASHKDVYVILNASRGGDKEEWLCIPWDPRKLNFVKGDKHVVAFMAYADGKVGTVIQQMKAKGWETTAVKHGIDSQSPQDLDKLLQ